MAIAAAFVGGEASNSMAKKSKQQQRPAAADDLVMTIASEDEVRALLSFVSAFVC